MQPLGQPRDPRVLRLQRAGVHLGVAVVGRVHLGEVRVFHTQPVDGKDRVDRAGVGARTAVDALLRVDVQDVGGTEPRLTLSGWMQPTGQTDTQPASLQHDWVIAKATARRDQRMWARRYQYAAGRVSSPTLSRNSMRCVQLPRIMEWKWLFFFRAAMACLRSRPAFT